MELPVGSAPATDLPQEGPLGFLLGPVAHRPGQRFGGCERRLWDPGRHTGHHNRFRLRSEPSVIYIGSEPGIGGSVGRGTIDTWS